MDTHPSPSFPPFAPSAPANYRDQFNLNRPIIPRCLSCGRSFFYPRFRCPHCFSADLGVTDCPDDWRVDASTLVHRPQADVFLAYAPVLIIAASHQDVPMIAEGTGWEYPTTPSIGEIVRLTVKMRPDGSRVLMFSAKNSCADHNPN